MNRSKTNQKFIAGVLLILFSVQTFCPVVAYALTSGPTTPEMASFEPASTANMVDPFSGDFSYNIPLLDVGGYPVNLSYHSGGGPEEEASWVGFGWTLNPGAINRQLRGLPDDFKGDVIMQEDKKKENVTVGANVNVSLKLFGNRLPKLNIGRKSKNLSGNMKVKIGIQHNNYTGYKGIIGLGTGFATSDDNSDLETGQLGPSSSMDPSASLGLNVDNQSGINPYANFEVNYKIKTKKEREAERDLNTVTRQHFGRSLINAVFFGGLIDLSKSKAQVSKMQDVLNHESHSGATLGASSAINFSGFHPPSLVQTPMNSKNFTASLSLGVTLFGGTVSPGIEGTYSKQELKDAFNSAPAYGFMNSDAARSKENALLDYNMEKESPYFKRLPNLGVTVFTPDLYNVTSNAGSMQFRPYLKGAGIFFQPHKHDDDKSIDIGLEPAFGNLFHIGVPLQLNKTNSTSGKWADKNSYVDVGDFKSTGTTDPANQAFYFKRVGEKNEQDGLYFNSMGGTAPVAVRLNNDVSSWAFGSGKALGSMRKKNDVDITNSQYVRSRRDKANHSIAYLTSYEASQYALQPQIPNYRENTLIVAPDAIKSWIGRTAGYRKPHHISQFTITQDDGQRMVYGTPVYNTIQEEVSFALPYNQSQMQNGIAVYNTGDNSVQNTNGKDYYYHKSLTPAYTTGHLLTAILSSDYVDVKSDGITDDDLGSAVKFNYSELSDAYGNPKFYKWRTPYTSGDGSFLRTANYNKGYESITDDDKGNYTYGEKELWYLHSIESKTMVAQFYTADRNDGLGVQGENGGKDVDAKPRKLTEIRLYSKSDLYANGPNAIPVKTVHLEYYDGDPIMNLLPNHQNGKGKLTLKRIWFSYGNNTKGHYNYYNFKYNIPASQDYQDFQSDRWGSYKPRTINPNGLDNLEFPYATQNKAAADNYASYWQLNEIELPSGAVITVQYEADDYAYVQDRRAAQMCFMTGIGAQGASSNFSRSDKIFVRLPAGTSNAELKKRYFDGLKSLAYKSFVDLDGKGHSEYVSGYAEIAAYRLVDGSGNPVAGNQTSDLVEITVGKINGKYNPLAKASWQKLKLDLPRYAYPEFDNLDDDGAGFIKAIKALGAAFGRFKDLVESFDARAERKHFGDQVNLSKSWVRLLTPIGISTGQGTIAGKLGGGHRVKEIRINDQWSQMSGVAAAENGSYGQRYDYTTQVTGPSGATEIVSSGVASYEPMMGGDENPFHEPINYSDKQLFGLPKYFYLERPMGESYFPAASIGYSKVTVRNLGADGSIGENGSTVNEFYTAKDFPTRVDELPIERRQPKIDFLPRLFGAKITSGATVSQGYVVENNDMNGKPKSEAAYGKNGNEISSVKYYYRTNDPKAEKQELNNTVDVVSKNLKISHTTVGMDVDMFTEMNQSSMENIGVAIDPSFGITWLVLIPKISIKLPLPKPNYEKRLYRGSTTVKLVNRYAILQKVVKTVNGSTSTSENLVWDAETGEVLLTKSNNEFEDPIYSFSYPAHWVYDGMGSSFRNEGIYLTGLITGSTGLINNYVNILSPGDELISMINDRSYWVIDVNQNPAAPPVLALVDENGVSLRSVNDNVKIMRSGKRNLAVASVGTIVSMNYPVVRNVLSPFGQISFSQSTQILDAKALQYNDDWHMPLDATCVQGATCWRVQTNNHTSAASLQFVAPYSRSVLAQDYSILGTRLYQAGYDAQGNAGTYFTLTSGYWKNTNMHCAQGPLNRTGVWPNTTLGRSSRGAAEEDSTGKKSSAATAGKELFSCNEVSGTTNKWLGQTFNYTAATDKTLYIGIAGDNNFRFKINGTVVVNRTSGVHENFRYWNIYPVCLTPGNYTFEFQAYNNGSFGTLGAEVYDNTLAQLQAATDDNDLSILFSTRNLSGVNVESGDGIGYSVPQGYYLQKIATNQYQGRQANALAPGAGQDLIFNPYRTGVKGNWRIRKDLVYDTKRINNKLNAADASGTDLRNSGYYATFNPYNWSPNAANALWQWSAEVKKFGRKGEPIESVDPLLRYSAAQHGYLESVPVAVASNAMHREIGFDGFEDYYFNVGQTQLTDSCGIQEHFNFRKSLGGNAQLDTMYSHTGKYSLKLTGPIALTKPLLDQEPATIYDINNNQYRRTSNYLSAGFSPRPSTAGETRKYVLSGWVYDGQPKSGQINNFSVTICGTSYNVNDYASNPATYSKVHVVEGWKRFEIVFSMPISGNFRLDLSGSNIYLDDLRIHPYNSQLKSFVYDATSMRLMAELDENNFASFYEYDDEGTLIRVKKETEKGISTIRETRSSLRKKQF